MRELKLLTGQRVIVTTEGAVFEGIVAASTQHHLELVDGVVVSQNQLPLDGRMLIPAGRILYVQVP